MESANTIIPTAGQVGLLPMLITISVAVSGLTYMTWTGISEHSPA